MKAVFGWMGKERENKKKKTSVKWKNKGRPLGRLFRNQWRKETVQHPLTFKKLPVAEEKHGINGV